MAKIERISFTLKNTKIKNTKDVKWFKKMAKELGWDHE